jgi:hypothetical protein
VITRRHFRGYKAGCAGNPPPLHVRSVNPHANHHDLPRPIEAGGHVGPALVLGGTGSVSLGIDPTDPLTWAGRGYNQSPGMIGWLNGPVQGLQGSGYRLNAYGGQTGWQG